MSAPPSDSSTLVQLGFTVGVGLLMDTFVVRTMVVPAFAALVGPRLWWPSRAPRSAGGAHAHDSVREDLAEEVLRTR